MKKVVLCMAVVAVLAITSLAPAATTYSEWRGTAGDGLWTNGANWNTGIAPNATDNAGVMGAPNFKAGFKTNLAATFTAGIITTDILVAGGTAVGGADLVIDGATLNVSEYISLAAGSTDIGYLQLKSGAINTGVQYNNVTFYVTQKGTGTLDMSGGTLTVGLNYPAPGTYGNLSLTSADLTGSGTLYMTGGNVYAADMLRGSGASALVTIASQTANIWLVGDETADMQQAVDDGWLTAGAGLDLRFEYDDLGDVTRVYAVPEPATVCLLGLGVLGLIRRK